MIFVLSIPLFLKWTVFDWDLRNEARSDDEIWLWKSHYNHISCMLHFSYNQNSDWWNKINYLLNLRALLKLTCVDWDLVVRNQPYSFGKNVGFDIKEYQYYCALRNSHKMGFSKRSVRSTKNCFVNILFFFKFCGNQGTKKKVRRRIFFCIFRNFSEKRFIKFSPFLKNRDFWWKIQ